MQTAKPAEHVPSEGHSGTDQLETNNATVVLRIEQSGMDSHLHRRRQGLISLLLTLAPEGCQNFLDCLILIDTGRFQVAAALEGQRRGIQHTLQIGCRSRWN